MAGMKVSYITIEREYGSGGTEIARRLAEAAGEPCYGREVLEEVSKKYDISPEGIDQYEETVSNSFLYTVFLMGQVQSGKTDALTKEGHIFVAEQAAIQQLAARGPAVFLGHCASQALKKYSGVVRAFIRSSDPQAKRRRAVAEYGVGEKDAEAVMKRFDKKRANYYFANTSKKWTDYSNYDIVLDSGSLGIEGCVRALRGLLEDPAFQK